MIHNSGDSMKILGIGMLYLPGLFCSLLVNSVMITISFFLIVVLAFPLFSFPIPFCLFSFYISFLSFFFHLSSLVQAPSSIHFYLPLHVFPPLPSYLFISFFMFSSPFPLPPPSVSFFIHLPALFAIVFWAHLSTSHPLFLSPSLSPPPSPSCTLFYLLFALFPFISSPFSTSLSSSSYHHSLLNPSPCSCPSHSLTSLSIHPSFSFPTYTFSVPALTRISHVISHMKIVFYM